MKLPGLLAAALGLSAASCGVDRVTAAAPAEVQPSPAAAVVAALNGRPSPVVAHLGPGAVIHIRCAPSFSADNPPLVVVDGRVLAHADLHRLQLDPTTIRSIEVMKGRTARELYGARAENGILIITLKH
jgi:hypothetical protein